MKARCKQENSNERLYEALRLIFRERPAAAVCWFLQDGGLQSATGNGTESP